MKLTCHSLFSKFFRGIKSKKWSHQKHLFFTRKRRILYPNVITQHVPHFFFKKNLSKSKKRNETPKKNFFACKHISDLGAKFNLYSWTIKKIIMITCDDRTTRYTNSTTKKLGQIVRIFNFGQQPNLRNHVGGNIFRHIPYHLPAISLVKSFF